MATKTHLTAQEITYLTQWLADSNTLEAAATTIENNGVTGDIAGLIQSIQTFETNTTAFIKTDHIHGALAADLTAEITAANGLIAGLTNHETGAINTAIAGMDTAETAVASFLPPPPPPPPPPPITTGVAETIVTLIPEFQTSVNEQLSASPAATTDLLQTAFDLGNDGYDLIHVYGGSNLDLTTMIAEVTMLANAVNQTETNNLLYDIGQVSHGAFDQILNHYSLPTNSFVTASATPPSPIALEDNATEWKFVTNIENGATPVQQNLNAAASGDGNHVPYTITQLQGFVDYVAQNQPDATFIAKFAPDMAHITAAGTEALKGLNDMLTNGGTASPNYAADQAEITVASAAIGTAAHDLLTHNMPPPNFWLV